ncbi:MAG: peptide-methionine (R)-S-oxide reductase MsrB [Candidatus Methylomirabilia bacterium]
MSNRMYVTPRKPGRPCSNGGVLLLVLLALGLASLPAACAAGSGSEKTGIAPLVKSRDEWRGLLPPERFDILFAEGTERAGTSPLNDEKRAGTFVCAACFLPLFESRDKFNSGTGWPSFAQPISGRLETKHDYRLFTPRTEYHCVRCGGHQGHVFEDGPPPSGQRWCNNGLALIFVPAGEPLPALRQ